jgi:2-aminobenzoate-CoA ligase
MPFTGHIDRWSREHLPQRDAMPEVWFDLPELQYPEKLNAAEVLLDRQIRRGHGARRAIVAPGRADWTYNDLYETANRIARVLSEDLGLVPGNRVLLRAPNTPMLAACWFGVLKAGGVAVTTMPLYRANELRNIVAKAEVSLALCDARLIDELEIAAEGNSSLRIVRFNCSDPGGLETLMNSKPAEFANVATGAEDVALIGFTSGTTGVPKAAAHYHRDVLATCDSYAKHVLQPRAEDLFCGSPPLGFTFGLGGLVLFPIYAGAATLLLEKPGPEELMRAIAQYRVTTVFTAPIAYRTMTNLADTYDISSLRTCVSAGETLPKSVWEGWHAKTGLRILDGIGSTEMLHIFIGSPADRVRPGSTGQPVPGYAAEIHDEDGNALPPENIGRLAVKGPTGCKYLADSRQANYVQNGWNYPGDAYRMDADGYFYYVARTDDMIVSAGYNVSGPEVEQVLLTHVDVKECAVVGKPDHERGTHIVKAYVVLVQTVLEQEQKADELREYVKQTIASFKAPREIEFVSELPRTETGKVQRFRLRERASAE